MDQRIRRNIAMIAASFEFHTGTFIKLNQRIDNIGDEWLYEFDEGLLTVSLLKLSIQIPGENILPFERLFHDYDC